MKMKVRCVEIFHCISFLEEKFLKKSVSRFAILCVPILSYFKYVEFYPIDLPSHWRKILSRYDPTRIIVSSPERQATFYVSPSEHSLDNQQQFHHNSSSFNNEKRQRCSSASCTSNNDQHIHSPILNISTTDVLLRTQSFSTKQRNRSFTTDHEIIMEEKSFLFTDIPNELYICSEIKHSIIDELTWNNYDFIFFDFNDIITNSKIYIYYF